MSALDAVERALEPYRHLDPSGWVALFRTFSTWGGAVALALGVILLFFGGRRLFRLVAGPLGGVAAVLWTGTLARRLGVSESAELVQMATPLVMLGAGLVFPPIVVFVVFGIPCGLFAGQLAGSNDWLLGFVPGFLVGGALGVMLHRPVAALLSAASGAWLTTMGLLALLQPAVPTVDSLVKKPLAVIAIASCFAFGGAIFQLFVRPSPEESQRLKHERFLAKKRQTERRQTEARWHRQAAKKP